MAANGSKTLRPNVRDGSTRTSAGATIMTALPAKPDIDGDRHAAPTKARGASAIAPLSTSASPNTRRMAGPRGGLPEDLFWEARKRKPDKVPGLTRWDRTRRAGPSGKATGPIQKNRPRLKERGVPINKGGRSR